MLERFEVENFKGFERPIVFDLSARDYSFNSEIIKNGIVNKALIYGKNGTGKSNLGSALFDIIYHLTDKERIGGNNYLFYKNLKHVDKPIRFYYRFNFDGDIIEYEYYKFDADNLLSERLTVNSENVLFFDYFNRNENHIDPIVSGDVSVNLVDNKLSIIKYLGRSTPTDYYPPLFKMIRFAENMLWYRSLSDGNMYAGHTNGIGNVLAPIYEMGKLKDFKEFLFENGIDYDMDFEATENGRMLFVYFNDRKNKAPFFDIASTGTKALELYYYWKTFAFKNISFLFIDEFDAFFHYESAEYLVKRLNKARSFQTILTTHNTYLMKNSLTRPDCCYIMANGQIKNLVDSSDREIREAHNLEKMYINGAFVE